MDNNGRGKRTFTFRNSGIEAEAGSAGVTVFDIFAQFREELGSKCRHEEKCGQEDT